jgi:hypothetical protein
MSDFPANIGQARPGTRTPNRFITSDTPGYTAGHGRSRNACLDWFSVGPLFALVALGLWSRWTLIGRGDERTSTARVRDRLGTPRRARIARRDPPRVIRTMRRRSCQRRRSTAAPGPRRTRLTDRRILRARRLAHPTGRSAVDPQASLQPEKHDAMIPLLDPRCWWALTHWCIQAYNGSHDRNLTPKWPTILQLIEK